jgi:hypothetical protein
MKTIIFPEDKAKSFCELLGMCCSIAPDKGQPFTIDEIRIAIKILDKVEAGSAVVELEDAEYALASRRTKAMTWKVASRDIAEFVAAIEVAS